MWELANQLDGAVLNIGQEVGTSGFKKTANGIRGNLLLDADHAVDLEYLVNINIDLLEGFNVDCGRGGASRSKGSRGISYRI